MKKYVKSIILEVLSEPIQKANIKQFLINNIKPNKRTIWDLMLTQNIETFKLSIKYYDENEFVVERDINANTFAHFKQLCELSKDEILESTPDMKYVQRIVLYVWYDYKGKRELESHNFMDYRESHYSLDSIDEVLLTLRNWINKYPEYLL